MAKPAMSATMLVQKTARSRIIPICTIGSGTRSSTSTQRARMTIEAAPRPSVSALVQPQLSPSLRATSRATRPADRVAAPGQSRRDGVRTGDSGTSLHTRIRAANDRDGADPEEPGPGQALEDHPAQHQPERAPHAEGGRQQPEAHAHAIARELVADDPEGQREDGAGRALQRARRDQEGDGARQGRGDGADGEDQHGDHQEPLLPVGVAQLAEERRGDGRGEQEAGEDPGRPGVRGVEVASGWSAAPAPPASAGGRRRCWRSPGRRASAPGAPARARPSPARQASFGPRPPLIAGYNR